MKRNTTRIDITVKLGGALAIGLCVYLVAQLALEYHVRHGLGAPVTTPEAALNHRLGVQPSGCFTNSYNEVFTFTNGQWFYSGPVTKSPIVNHQPMGKMAQ